MRRLFILVVLLAVVIGLIGLWRGWWSMTVDKNKFRQDEQSAKEKLGDVKDNLKKDASVIGK